MSAPLSFDTLKSWSGTGEIFEFDMIMDGDERVGVDVDGRD